MPSPTALQRRVVRNGAMLFLVGLVTGLWAAAALTGVVTLPKPRLALAAHLNGLLGGMWVVVVALTFPFVQYSEKQLERLALLVTVPSWANLILTFVASCIGQNGLTYTGDRGNDVLAFALQALVVLPSLLGACYWVRGLCLRGANT